MPDITLKTDMTLTVTLRLMAHNSSNLRNPTMFKTAKRKLATATHKIARRARAHAAFKRPTDSSSDGEPLPDPWKRILPKERASSPRPGLRKKRKALVKNLAESEKNVSSQDLDSDDRTASGTAINPPLGSKDQENDSPQPCVRGQSNSNQQEARGSILGNEDMRIITIHAPHQQFQALLLPPSTFQRTRALVHARQDLRAVESELATTAAEMDSLVAAQRELEKQDHREIPGSFLDDDAHADNERRGLLTSTIEKKIRFCGLTLEDLEAQRPQMRAVASASRSKAAGSGKAGAWTTMRDWWTSRVGSEKLALAHCCHT